MPAKIRVMLCPQYQPGRRTPPLDNTAITRSLVSRTVEVVPAASNADLTVTGLTMNPAAPARAPGATFSVTATVQNAGTAPSGSSTVR
jgi:hypothetical protein